MPFIGPGKLALDNGRIKPAEEVSHGDAEPVAGSTATSVAKATRVSRRMRYLPIEARHFVWRLLVAQPNLAD